MCNPSLLIQDTFQLHVKYENKAQFTSHIRIHIFPSGNVLCKEKIIYTIHVDVDIISLYVLHCKSFYRCHFPSHENWNICT